MLTRRHIRVKVMQSLYALFRNDEPNTAAEKRFLEKSMTDMYDQFLLDLSLLLEVKNFAQDYLEKSQKKHLATQEEIHPNLNFIENGVLAKIEQNEAFNDLLEKNKLYHWRKEPHYVQLIWEQLRQTTLYKSYTSNSRASFEEDKRFIIDFFKEVIAPNEKIHDYLEDTKITWMDDLPIVNTSIVKTLKKMKATEPFRLPKLFKSEDDRQFAFDLFNRTLMYKHDFEESINRQTPNWDKDRLAEIDSILIKMALCEFIRFPSIPVKVTINEYLEISKEYSTPKSSIFINGVLDRLSKEYEKEGRLNKIGRGLL